MIDHAARCIQAWGTHRLRSWLPKTEDDEESEPEPDCLQPQVIWAADPHPCINCCPIPVRITIERDEPESPPMPGGWPEEENEAMWTEMPNPNAANIEAVEIAKLHSDFTMKIRMQQQTREQEEITDKADRSVVIEEAFSMHVACRRAQGRAPHALAERPRVFEDPKEPERERKLPPGVPASAVW